METPPPPQGARARSSLTVYPTSSAQPLDHVVSMTPPTPPYQYPYRVQLLPLHVFSRVLTCSMICFCFVASLQFFAIIFFVTGSHIFLLSFSCCSSIGRTCLGTRSKVSRSIRTRHSYREQRTTCINIQRDHRNITQPTSRARG